MTHVARVLQGPLPGIYSTHMLSGQHFGRHWHDAYGFGILEQGAQRSSSGRGQVEAFAGQVITSNPGEVHDGSPLGGPTRRWRILTVDTEVFASLIERNGAPGEITRPVIDDPSLFQVLRRLFGRIERWSARAGNRTVEALACEESLVEATLLLVARHGTAPAHTDTPGHELRQLRRPRQAHQMRRLRERLADAPFDAPSLADMAMMTGLSRYQVLRQFAGAYGLPPHAWLLSCRAEHALRLIRHRGLSAPRGTPAGGGRPRNLQCMGGRLRGRLCVCNPLFHHSVLCHRASTRLPRSVCLPGHPAGAAGHLPPLDGP